ncbi:integrase, catalytic region, zinc finger, CCHC-type containing protein [Tanacetum coccineum]
MENLNFFYQDIGTSSSAGGHLTQEEAAKKAIAIRLSRKFALLEEERPIIKTMAYHDKYKKFLDEVWKDRVELDGKIVKEKEEAIKRIKGEALKEKDDPGAFIFPIRLEGQLGRKDIKKVDRGLTMINHTQAEAMGILTNVLCQVGVTTLSAKFLILDILIDRDSPIVVGWGFLRTIGGIVNTLERLFSTFDGFCHQNFRAARSDFMRNAESDSDDEEDYQIKRTKFGSPIYGPKPAPYLNCNDPDERSLAIQNQVNWKPDYKGSYTKEEATGQWQTEIRLWEHTIMRPDHQDPNALDNMKPWKRYCFYKFTMSSCYGKDVTEMQICADDELQTKRIIKFRLGGRAHILTLLEFARTLGLYHADELEENGFNVYFEGGLRSDEHFNAQDYWMTRYDKIQKNDLWILSMFDARHQNEYANVAWVIARWMKKKGVGTQKESQIYYGQFISKIARKCRVLTEYVVRSLSALIYYRDLDTITLRDLIDSDDKLIPEDLQPGVPRVGIPRPSRASMHDLYDRMGMMEIRQEAIERMEYRQSYHWDGYQGVFEHMAGVYSVPMQGAYNPPGYAQPQYDQYYQQYPPPPPQYQQQQDDDEYNSKSTLQQAGINFDYGANQHLTYTDKDLVNVIDISYLKIKVSHPNGTKVFIAKVRNLVLTNFLTLYDVLVVPEYCVSLVYVHKVARVSKFIVAFDESKSFVLSQDMMDVKVMGIGKQTMGTHDDEAGSLRSKRPREHETVEEVLLPQVHHKFLLWEGCNRDAKSRYNTRLDQLLPRHIYSPCIVHWDVLNIIGCDGDIDDMLRIRLREATSNKEIFTFVAWIRAFNINEPIYTELCHKFYSTYEFDEVCADDEFQTKKIIKFRLGGCAHSLTLLEFAQRLGLYQAVELEEEGFNVYFEGGLRSDEHFNAQDYWLSIRREENLGLSRSHTSTIRNPILRFISKIARKCRVLTEYVARSLSAPIYCRDLDTITLRDLINSDGKLIPDDPQPGVPRVGIPRPPRASMQDLYVKMGRMEIRQEAIERMEYRQSYHWDMYHYQGVFEHMAGAAINFDYGANQHWTYTDKDLVNVIDISYLKIKVSHPSGTKDFIAKVGNLVLTNFLTLYDVLVVPEYYVSLVSVHKVARDTKFIVAFDESKCFVLSQDLMDVKVMGIGKQVGGLYYFDKDQGPYMVCLCFATILNNNDKFSSRAEKCVLVGISSFKKGCKSFSLERKQFLFSKDVKLFETVFPFKIKQGSMVNKDSQGLDHVNLFNEVVYEDLDTPNDDTNLNAHPQDEGSNSSNPNSPSIDLFEDDFGHHLGSNGSTNENERATTSKDDSVISEGDVVNILDTNPIQIWVCRLKKLLYGLKQAPKQCNTILTQALHKDGFCHSKSGYSLLTKTHNNDFLALLVYVDDIIVTGSNIHEIEKFKGFLKSKFMIKDLGKLKYFWALRLWIPTMVYVYLKEITA